MAETRQTIIDLEEARLLARERKRLRPPVA